MWNENLPVDLLIGKETRIAEWKTTLAIGKVMREMK